MKAAKKRRIFPLLFLLITSLSQSKEIILISHQSSLNETALIQKIMTKNLEIPKGFISFRYVNFPCQKKNKRVKLHLCLDEEGIIHPLYIDKLFISTVIPIFLKEREQRVMKNKEGK